MLKKMTKILMVFLAGILVTGCASTKKTIKQEPGKTTATTKKLETHFYVEDRQREDQEMKGNFGYISGTPQPEDRSGFKKTRKIYVFEVTKNVDEAVSMGDVKVEPYVPSKSEPLPPPHKTTEPDWVKPVKINMDLDQEPASDESVSQDYVIAQGDTLQKISKKFYGTYSKWVQIYDANKDVLKDPNRIKPGIKIQIP